MQTFRKTGSRRAIATEAASLRWLADVEGGAAVAELASVQQTSLETVLLQQASPSVEEAAEFGRRLAHTHAAGASWWGEAPPGLDPGDLATANLPTPAAAEPTWLSFGDYYAEARLRPYIDLARHIDDDARGLLHRACDAVATGRFDSPQPSLCPPVARIHGDLWGGNVVWARRGDGVVGTLIDPCANGGHAETDLAELGLFGSPRLEATIRGYHEVSQLADGWVERIDLHQFHMVLVHVVLFGGSYLEHAVRTARALLR